MVLAWYGARLDGGQEVLLASADTLAVLLTPLLLGGVAVEAWLRSRRGLGTDLRATLNNVAVAAAQRVTSSAVGFVPFVRAMDGGRHRA